MGGITYLIDIVVYKNKKIGALPMINYIYNSNWFLWTVFFTAILSYVLVFIFKKKEIALAFLLILNFILPDALEYFHYTSVRRLLLFFLAGIMINDKKIISKLRRHYYWIALGVNLAIYICIILLVLKQKLNFPNQICFLNGIKDTAKQLLQIAMQLSGCISVILIIYKLQQKFELHLLRKMGEKSIVLYVFSGLVFYFLIKDYCRVPEAYRYLYKIGYVSLISILTTGISYVVAALCDKNKWTRKLLLGKCKI